MKSMKQFMTKTLGLLLSGLLLVTSVPVSPAFGGTNYWAVFNKAEADLKAKKYAAALKEFEQVLPEFKSRKDSLNIALIFGRMAKCHAELGQYDQASQDWKTEASYWQMLKKNQDMLIALRKADAVTSDVRVFALRPASEAGKTYYHGAKFEPVLGAYIGAYAEADKAVHDPYSPTKRYQLMFPELTGKKHASYLLYFTYGQDIDSYKSHFMKAKETGTAVQLALQPRKGMKEIQQDAWLESFINKLDSYGVPVFLRLANEMNEPSAPWFGPASEYVPKFRLFADAVHKSAQNIVMVWAPAWFPPDTVDAYYPGDAYVDWVGLSMYKVPNPELDPLGKGVDRESYLNKLDRIYKTYNPKKPIFISEGGISYSDIKTGKDTTPWAVDQMDKFYTYLPMLYPGVKALYWFDSTKSVEGIPRSYLLSANKTVLDHYKQGISSEFYLSDLEASASHYYQPLNSGTVKAEPQTISTYVKAIDPNVASVAYSINGVKVFKSAQMPYAAELDFTPYSGKTITLTVTAYNAKNSVLTEKKFTYKVQ